MGISATLAGKGELSNLPCPWNRKVPRPGSGWQFWCGVGDWLR